MENDRIDSFRGAFDFLSNFYEAPLVFGGIPFRCAEAAFQAQKCRDYGERAAFSGLSGVRAKRKGRQVALREGWNDMRVDIMAAVLEAKFTQNPDLAARLIATGNRPLIEGNTWRDTFWGVSARTGRGENHLGRLLMALRDRLREQP